LWYGKIKTEGVRMKNMKKIGIIAICLVLLGAGIIFYKHSANEEPVVSIEENNLREPGGGIIFQR